MNELNSTKTLCPYEKFGEDSSDQEVSENSDNMFSSATSPKNDNLLTKKQKSNVVCNSCKNDYNHSLNLKNNKFADDKEFTINHKDGWFKNETKELNSNEMINV